MPATAHSRRNRNRNRNCALSPQPQPTPQPQLKPRPLPVDREIGAAERVANERRGDDVRDLLTSAGMTAKVAVCPAWFVATVGD